MPSLGVKALCCTVPLYGAWMFLVVRRAARTPSLFGPRWLANLVSSCLYNFGGWWADYSNDADECKKAGVFEESKQYIIVFHPHGNFTIAALYFFSHLAAADKVFTKRRLYCGVADLLLSIPLLAEYLLFCNGRSISGKAVDKILSEGHGLAIQPGGIYEQVRTDASKETIYFSGSLGFIRKAIKHGVPLLPVYAFGENQLYDTSSWLRAVNVWLYNKFKIGSLFVHSGTLAGIPVSPVLPSPLMLPKKGAGLHVRWGKPVEVGPKDENPSDEKVLEVFDKYKAAILELFDTHKGKLLPPEVASKGLTIVLRGKEKSS